MKRHLARVALMFLIFLPLAGCSSADHRTCFQIFQAYPEDYDVNGVRLLSGTNHDLNGLDLFGYQLSGKLNGLQISPIIGLCNGGMTGGQVGLSTGIYKGAQGFQLAVLLAQQGEEYGEKGRFSGLQGGVGLALNYGEMRGVQAGGVAAVSGGTLSGIQLALLISGADDMNGFQAALVGTNAKGRFKGIKVSFLNVANSKMGSAEMHGLQLGLVNYVNELDGVQVGLVNISENGGLSFCPLINCTLFSPRHPVPKIHGENGEKKWTNSARRGDGPKSYKNEVDSP